MLKITVQKLGDARVFRCTGRIVYGSEDQLMTALSRQRFLRVAVFDLARVRMIDAAGLGALIAVRKRANTIGIKFRLMNLHPSAEDLLVLTNLRSVLEVCSVPEILDLLCRAWNPPAKVRNRAKRTPLKVIDHAAASRKVAFLAF
jgi:anti-anti-sigma factor